MHSVLQKPDTNPDVKAPGVAVESDATCDTCVVVGNDTAIEVRTTLSDRGHRVHVAGSCEQAIELVQSHRPELVVLSEALCGSNPVEAHRSLCGALTACDAHAVFLIPRMSIIGKQRIFEATGRVCVDPGSLELHDQLRLHADLAGYRHRATVAEGRVADQRERLDQLRTGQNQILASPSDFPDINICVHYEPALEAGGDFYDIVRFSDDCFGFLVADVSGHDLGVAYLTGALKALSVSFTSDGLSVEETAFMLNAALGKFLCKHQYATACYVKYFKSSGRVEILSAAHPEALLQRADGETQYLDIVGDVLGMHETVICGSTVVSVAPGDRLFLFTDGLTEGYVSADGKTGSRSFGTRQLEEAVSRRRSSTLRETIDYVIDDLKTSCRGCLTDDVVLMGIAF